MHFRGQMRQDLRQALSDSSDFQEWTVLKSWGQNLSDENLPAVGVFTPRETTQRFDADGPQHSTIVVIQARLRGNDDLEDLMDDAGDLLAEVALPVLENAADEADLTETALDVSGEGSARIGKIELMFRVTRYAEET